MAAVDSVPLPDHRIRVWLATNWIVVLWLVTAIAVGIATVSAPQELFDDIASLSAVAEEDREAMRDALAALGVSPRAIAWYQVVAVGSISALLNLSIGWLLIRKRPRTRFTIFLAFFALAANNAVYPPEIDDIFAGQPIAQLITQLTTATFISGFFVLPFLFPDGRPVPRWTVIPAGVQVILVLQFVFFPNFSGVSSIPTQTEAVFTLAYIIAAIVAMTYRYRRVSTPEQRRQTRWVMFGLMIALPTFFLGDAMMRNIDGSPAGVACLFGFLILMPIAFATPMVTLGIAMLRHRLYDIDLLLSRTMVWLLLSLAVTLVYIGVVVGVGTMIGSRGNLLLSLLATGLVAIGFQPLRQRLQRVAANRLVYGERDEPYSILSRLGHQIEDSLSSSDLLPTILRTTAEMLRLPYLALQLNTASGPMVAAVAGQERPTSLHLPLVYQGQTLGRLDVASRAPGEVFGQADRALLTDLARQIGIAVRTVNLTDELQRSREEIVLSREEERRRLRRDLHDGLGGQLAALIMQAGTVRTLVQTDPEAADRELADLRDELRQSVAEVRRLVLGLRPPALDELGLVGALRARLTRFERGGLDAGSHPLRVNISAAEPLPPLSAAVEVAAYRIVEEAVTNVVKHAQATNATVSIAVIDATLALTIADDGIGWQHTSDQSGMGLESMRQRASEVGGIWAIAPTNAAGGTTIRVRLPLDSAGGVR